jgi:phosphoglycolate phosphatase-like HAD superfamily hydrolase
MRFNEIKKSLLEASVLNAKDLMKHGNDDRINALMNILKTGTTTTTTTGEKFTPDKEYYSDPQNLKNIENEIRTQAQATAQKPFTVVGFVGDNKESQEVQSNALKKFPGAGSRQSSADDVANVGELMEILHAAAVYARLINGTKPIGEAEVQRIIDQLQNGKKIVGQGEDIKSKKFDKFTIMIRASDDIFRDAKRPDILQHPKVASLLKNAVIPDANDNTGDYANKYATNGEYDEVNIVGDGLSDQSGTKSDISFVNSVTGKTAKFSLKANSTKELHQVGLGKVTASMQERYAIASEFFNEMGVNVAGEEEAARKEFESATDIASANVILFRQAYDEFQRIFEGEFDPAERTAMRQLMNTIKTFARRQEDGIDVKQFTSKGYFVLDVELLDKLAEDEKFNFNVKYISTMSSKFKIPLPKIRFFDPNGKDFLTIRTYAAGSPESPYLRIKVDKGEAFKKYTTKKTNIAKA